MAPRKRKPGFKGPPRPPSRAHHSSKHAEREPKPAPRESYHAPRPPVVRSEERAAPRPPAPARPPAPPRAAATPAGTFWIYGLHAVRAALANPRRKIRRAVMTARVREELGRAAEQVQAEIVDIDAVGRLLPYGSVHQGAAILCEPLPDLDLESLLDTLPAGNRLIAVLDQVTDPHNEGAILRSAAAFGVAAIVVQDRHAPPESGALAKAASGALDRIPRIAVVNIARTLEILGRLGFWRIALVADGDEALSQAAPAGDVALVLGAEGAGIRRLVRERCDQSAFISMMDGAESLNVSNAAAIAFYEMRRKAG